MQLDDIFVQVWSVRTDCNWLVETDYNHTDQTGLGLQLDFEFHHPTYLMVGFKDGGYNFTVWTTGQYRDMVTADMGKLVKDRVSAVLKGYYAPQDHGDLDIQRVSDNAVGPNHVVVQVNRRFDNQLTHDTLVSALGQIHGVRDASVLNGQNTCRVSVILANNIFDPEDVAAEVVELTEGAFAAG